MKILVRVLIGSLTAVIFGVAVLTVSPAQAKDVICDEAGACETFCTQNLPNGDRVRYKEGTEITIVTADGQEHKFVCRNGRWERASIAVGGKIKTIGAIGVASIAGIKGDLTATSCNDSPEPVCEITQNTVGAPGRSARLQ